MTPFNCYVLLGFLMLLKGKISSIPADFSDPKPRSLLQLVASNRIMGKARLLYVNTALDSLP